MKIQLYGGPRDGQEYEVYGDPPTVDVQLCFASDLIGDDALPVEAVLERIGQTVTYRRSRCGRFYYHQDVRTPELWA